MFVARPGVQFASVGADVHTGRPVAQSYRCQDSSDASCAGGGNTSLSMVTAMEPLRGSH
jgi:hypothetical protein